MDTEFLTLENVSAYTSKILNKEQKLVSLPKKKLLQEAAFHWLIGFFEHGRLYKEKEVNEILNEHCLSSDASLLRRELFNHYVLSRTYDGSVYWRSDFLFYQFSLLNYTFEDFKEEMADALISLHDSLVFYQEVTKTVFTKEDAMALITHNDLPPDGNSYFFGGKAIYDEGHNLVGYFSYYEGYPSVETLWIASFFFDSKYHQKGIGSLVFEQIITAARFCGFQKIGIGVYQKNIPALSFWKKQGFFETSISRIDEQKEAILRLEKELS